jgi:hypothetical protein
MGNKPELRFKFIQENAAFAGDDMLDIWQNENYLIV